MIHTIDKFYKVLVIAVDVFESRIIDEKHFSSEKAATEFQETLKGTNYISVAVEL